MGYPTVLSRTKNWGTEILTDTDLEGQLDLIISWLNAAVDKSSGHKHDGTTSEGPKITTLASACAVGATPTTDSGVANKGYVDDTATKTIVWIIQGGQAVDTELSGRPYIDVDGTITNARAYAKTAPTGAALLFDINMNGATIWSTQTNRLTIAAGANSGTTTTFNTTAITSGSYFTLDVDQVGSTVAGSDITIALTIQPK